LALALHRSYQGLPELNRQTESAHVKDASDVRTAVSRADLDAEAHIAQSLLVEMGYNVLSEESGLRSVPGAQHTAIIDPLDGSMNHLKDTLGLYAVSIGLVRRGEAVAGAIYLPEFGFSVLAQAGHGAFLVTGQERVEKIERSPGGAASIENARLCIARGSAHPSVLARPPLSILMSTCAEAVNFASCCVGLACVALGKIDALVIPQQHLWDFAAGHCIVREIGGQFETWTGLWESKSDAPFSHLTESACFDIVVSSNERLFDQIVERID
jgi:myo-inositol-1(or 4)-monophosphatase